MKDKDKITFLPVTLTDLENLVKHQIRLFHGQLNDALIIKINVVSDMTCLSEGIIMSKVKRGEFPEPVMTHRNRMAWKRRDVIDWISQLPYIQYRSNK